MVKKCIFENKDGLDLNTGVWSSTRWDRNLAGLQPSQYWVGSPDHRVALVSTNLSAACP